MNEQRIVILLQEHSQTTEDTVDAESNASPRKVRKEEFSESTRTACNSTPSISGERGSGYEF
jgi:hypothetical protein